MGKTALGIGALGITLVGCSTSDGAPAVVGRVLPPANAAFDYQLGGAYEPTAATEIIARDRTATPDANRYNICYVNGFQTQPGETAMWLDDNPDLLLRDGDGDPQIDPEWPDEFILDTSTDEKRTRLEVIVGGWIDECADRGFQAVEIDNLDTYSRFPELLTADAAVDFARALSDRAHEVGMAIGQKNSAELVSRRAETAFDFAVVEQCNKYDECAQFTAGYGDVVFIIEYEREDFERGCVAYPQLSIVLRDLELSAAGAPGYLNESC
ncbi:MAG: endo alpha-1,4 polygalactosaminidase [Actinobacteria bacterium]|nr:endo alpha-1,4 polygalactosaminidase [Actinomycetota bacterium]